MVQHPSKEFYYNTKLPGEQLPTPVWATRLIHPPAFPLNARPPEALLPQTPKLGTIVDIRLRATQITYFR